MKRARRGGNRARALEQGKRSMGHYTADHAELSIADAVRAARDRADVAAVIAQAMAALRGVEALAQRATLADLLTVQELVGAASVDAIPLAALAAHLRARDAARRARRGRKPGPAAPATIRQALDYYECNKDRVTLSAVALKFYVSVSTLKRYRKRFDANF